MEDSDLSPDGTGSADQETRLCEACGLCCLGVLHSAAQLQPEELPRARGLGLTVWEQPTGSVFSLPCPLYRDHGCTIYPQRPHVCGAYACLLLRRLRAAEVSFAVALPLAVSARAQYEQIMSRLPEGATAPERFWELTLPVSNLAPSQDMLLDLVTLDVTCRRHFGLQRLTEPKQPAEAE